MKNLELRKTHKGNKILYEVIEDDKVIATRISVIDRNYVACAVTEKVKNGEPFFHAEFFFGRMDLIGKGSSKWVFDNSRVYAVARLTK